LRLLIWDLLALLKLLQYTHHWLHLHINHVKTREVYINIGKQNFIIYFPCSCMQMLAAYCENIMKSNTTLNISEMTTATYLWKLKYDNLVGKKTLNFIKKNRILSFWAKWWFFLKPWSLKGGVRQDPPVISHFGISLSL